MILMLFGRQILSMIIIVLETWMEDKPAIES